MNPWVNTNDVSLPKLFHLSSMFKQKITMTITNQKKIMYRELGLTLFPGGPGGPASPEGPGGP